MKAISDIAKYCFEWTAIDMTRNSKQGGNLLHVHKYNWFSLGDFGL